VYRIYYIAVLYSYLVSPSITVRSTRPITLRPWKGVLCEREIICMVSISLSSSTESAVTGLTYPEEFERIRPLLPHTFLLIPGYGAQGGTGKDIAGFFKEGVRGVVNSSRGILTAHKGKSEDARFTDHTRKAVLDMKNDILQQL